MCAARLHALQRLQIAGVGARAQQGATICRLRGWAACGHRIGCPCTCLPVLTVLWLCTETVRGWMCLPKGLLAPAGKQAAAVHAPAAAGARHHSVERRRRLGF